MEHMKTKIKQIKGIDALTGKPITWFKTEKLRMPDAKQSDTIKES